MTISSVWPRPAAARSTRLAGEAAGLQAMLGYLETGKWTPLGQPNATLLAHLGERAALEKRRDTLNESVAEINKKLEELDKTIAKVGSEAAPAAPEGEGK